MTENILKLEHKLSKDFVSHVATGAILSGPTSDGLFHFVFYRDAVWIEYESGRPIPEKANTYESYIDAGDIKNFREDQARISMSEKVLRSLSELIQKKLEKKDEAKTDNRA
ncbi:MAG: hypothetical protein MN733_01540 [Nitrososphaera sp.]|nr:hypothetical protein [Nitrososphaera sp.]